MKKEELEVAEDGGYIKHGVVHYDLKTSPKSELLKQLDEVTEEDLLKDLPF